MMEIDPAWGGDLGLLVQICCCVVVVLKFLPKFLVDLAACATAFSKDPTVHNRLRKLSRDMSAYSLLRRKLTRVSQRD